MTECALNFFNFRSSMPDNANLTLSQQHYTYKNRCSSILYESIGIFSVRSSECTSNDHRNDKNSIDIDTRLN